MPGRMTSKVTRSMTWKLIRRMTWRIKCCVPFKMTRRMTDDEMEDDMLGDIVDDTTNGE